MSTSFQSKTSGRKAYPLTWKSMTIGTFRRTLTSAYADLASVTDSLGDTVMHHGLTPISYRS